MPPLDHAKPGNFAFSFARSFFISAKRFSEPNVRFPRGSPPPSPNAPARSRSTGSTGHATTAEGKPYADVCSLSRYTSLVSKGPNFANSPPGGVDGSGPDRSQLLTAHSAPTVAPPDRRATALRAAETVGHASPSAAAAAWKCASRTRSETRRGMGGCAA